jgi:protocatechuate 3,4-dioxygenase beta subunit
VGKTWLPPVARRLGVGLLTAGLLASTATASQAVAASTATAHGRHAPARVNPALVNAAAAARMRASSAARAAGHTGIISGEVRSEAGSAVRGACVTALGHDANASARTGPDGRYLFGGLRPGQYRVSAGACVGATRPSARAAISAYWTSGPASVTVRAGMISHPSPISTWHLDLTSAHRVAPVGDVRAKTGSISGLVTAKGRPLRGVCALAAPLRGNGPEVIAVTGKTGKYRITRLRPGRYEVAFFVGLLPRCTNQGNWLIQIYPDVNSLSPNHKVTAVRVRAGKDTGHIDAHLKKGAEISGTVRAKSGRALRGICVNVTASIEGKDFVEIIDYNLATGKAGQFAARGLYPLGYQVQFSAGCRNKANYATQWWRDARSQARATTIRIRGTRHVAGINATLLPGASVSGVVKAVNASGKPLAGVCVTVTDPAGHFLTFAQTRRNGSYRVIGLSSGKVTIQFDPTCEDGSLTYLIVNRSIKLIAGQAVSGFNVYLPRAGGISGVVTDAHGRPLGGICVQINDENEDLTQTRPNGHYSIGGIENGSFQVVFFGGCGNGGSVAPQFYPNSPTSLLAKLVRFKPNTITPGIDATMQPGATVSGLVTDKAGRRLSRVCVSTYTTQLGLPTFIDTGFAIAKSGKYLIPNLEPGTYGIVFGCAGYGQEFFPDQVNEGAAGLLSVNADGTTRAPVTRLSRAGAITGKVTTKSGKPGSACVQATPADGRNTFLPVGSGYTDKNGHYRIGGLAPARYLVQFVDCSEPPNNLATQWYRRASAELHATVVNVRPGRTNAGINAVLAPGATITGRVTGPTGRPAKAICVAAVSRQAQFDAFSRTGRGGRYRLTGLSTGRWSLTFIPCSPRSDLARVNRPGTVRVTAPHTVTGVNIKLPLGGSVSGRVSSQVGGRPLGNVCVLLLPVRASGVFDFGFGFTDGHGRYVASQLKVGRYRAYIGDPSCDDFPELEPPVAPQWYNGQPAQATATTVRVSRGVTTSGINGVLAPFATVTGTVDTTAHAPVPGECVTAVPFRAVADPVTGLPAQQEVAVTDRTGGYTLTTLMPGRYKIEFSTGCGNRGFATQWWDNARSARSAKVITVKFATITGINATLRK